MLWSWLGMCNMASRHCGWDIAFRTSQPTLISGGTVEAFSPLENKVLSSQLHLGQRET